MECDFQMKASVPCFGSKARNEPVQCSLYAFYKTLILLKYFLGCGDDDDASSFDASSALCQILPKVELGVIWRTEKCSVDVKLCKRSCD